MEHYYTIFDDDVGQIGFIAPLEPTTSILLYIAAGVVILFIILAILIYIRHQKVADRVNKLEKQETMQNRLAAADKQKGVSEEPLVLNQDRDTLQELNGSTDV